MRVLYLIFLFPFHISSSGGYKFKIEVAEIRGNQSFHRIQFREESGWKLKILPRKLYTFLLSV